MAFGGNGFTTGTSFENRPAGPLDASVGDEAEGEGDLFWLRLDEEGTPVGIVDGAVVTDYAKGAAYDYAAHGTVRNGYLDENERTTNKFLAVDLDVPLDRTILPRNDATVSNAYLKTADYDGVYADTLVKFSPSFAGPVVDGADRIVVWMKESEILDDRGSVAKVVTNVMVTAGRYAGDYDKVEAADYKIASPAVAADTWCRLTIRAIPDVTEYRTKAATTIAQQAAGFTIYFDGQPAVIDEADGDIGIGSVRRPDILSPEARVLISERRLFPGLAKSKTDNALTLSRLTVGGLGAVDDVSFSTERPGHVNAENVFTLNWDAGIVGVMTCIVSRAGAPTTTNAIDTAELPRYRDFSLGTNDYALVTVTNVMYDVARHYSNGVWKAERGCEAEGNTFVCTNATDNPTGYVLSSLDVISVGGSGCETFAEALQRAREKGGQQTIVLMTNVVIAITPRGPPYRDSGYLPVSTGDDLVLDLNGHTLQGKLGSKGSATISQTGGKLLITDSSEAKTGRVLPRVGDPNRIAVKSHAKQSVTPVLTIEAGWYDGLVAVTGDVDRISGIGNAKYQAVCCIKGGSYTNFYNDAYHFYLEQYATNAVPPQYFSLVDNYWTAATNGYVWCGAGADDLWTNADNWKGKMVPGAGDLAIFPATNGAWNVDFGTGVATKALWIDGDIAMSGTNEFSDVKVVSGNGRIVGAGLAAFTGRLPGMLTGETGTGEIRLGAGWRGQVRISSVTNRAETLTDIMGWGNARSRVEFNGVRGYLSDRLNHEMAYELILTDLVSADGAKRYDAWKNETGYTGSVISFPRLSGSGTFDSPKNLREVLQVIQFMDVKDFTGVFKLAGKRILLGTGVVTSKAKAGHFTFSNQVGVRSGLGWEGVSAHFGTNLVVYGKLKQELMSYDKKESPAVQSAYVTLIDPEEGTTNEMFRLKAEVAAGAGRGSISVVTGDSVDYDGQSLPAEDMGGTLKDGSTFVIPGGSAVTIRDNMVIVNGVVASTFADYYRVMSEDGTTYSVKFDAEEATPTLAEFTISEADGRVSIKVNNVQEGLWYGLQTTSSLTTAWQGPAEWKQPEGDALTFNPDMADTSTFFRVIVTDRDPNGGGK